MPPAELASHNCLNHLAADFSASAHLASGELVALLPRYSPQQMGIYGICTSRQHLSAILRSMLDFLVEWFKAA